MSQINTLTKNQEDRIPFFIEKWVRMASGETDRGTGMKFVKDMYLSMKEKKPIVVYGQSPLSTAIIGALFLSLVKTDKKKLSSQLRSQLHSQLHSQLDSQLYSQLSSQLKNINADWYLSMWWLVWCGWYDYGKYIGIEFTKESYDLFMGFISNVGFSIPYKEICFVSDKPIEICWENGKLHKENAPAVKYSDGYSMWCLNGVSVPQYLAETKKEKLDIGFFKKEQNAQVRTEFIKKYGIERMKSLGKAKDRRGDYEVIDMSDIFNSLKYAPYLFMVNPSTGENHAEGVHPDCQTVNDAINWRAGNIKEEWKPAVLT